MKNNILVIYGDDTIKSYERFKDAVRKAKEKGWQVEKSLENFGSASLFTNKIVYIIHYDKTLTQNLLKKLPRDAKLEEFKLPKLIYLFLDSFYPSNYKKCIHLFHEALKTEPQEFLFALLGKHVRDLYWVKNDEKSLDYPSWRISKLKVQANKFSKERLNELIKELSKIDIDVKTSKASLVDSLDLVILEKLQ